MKEFKTVDHGGAKVEMAVVQDGAGKLEEVEIVREDTDDNRKDLDGSLLAENDTTTPGREVEIEVNQ